MINPRRSGHTLVEMTVVVTILSVLMSLVVRAQRPFSEMVMELQDRSTTSSELHLAVDFLATDLGGADRLERQADDRLLIVREQALMRRAGLPEGSVDLGVRYSFRDGQLIREDLLVGEKFVVATGMTGFQVAPPSGGETRLVLSDGVAEDDQHSVTLVWRRR